jgi:hypothetical protein
MVSILKCKFGLQVFQGRSDNQGFCMYIGQRPGCVTPIDLVDWFTPVLLSERPNTVGRFWYVSGTDINFVGVGIAVDLPHIFINIHWTAHKLYHFGYPMFTHPTAKSCPTFGAVAYLAFPLFLATLVTAATVELFATGSTVVVFAVHVWHAAV